MKVVIDIPEDMYNDANILIVKDLPVLRKIIANGTPLPKGHGRLIDIDNDLYDLDRRRVEYAPTILEADEEDKPTICDNCIHDEVCGLEGHLDPALTYCGWKEEIRPKGKWNIVQKDDNEIHEIECPFCKYSKGGRSTSVIVTFNELPHFCESCGADMRGEL